MGYVLRLSDEIHDWLADLRGTDPGAALAAGRALLALLTEGPGLGPPLVRPVAWAGQAGELADGLDYAHQQQLARLNIVRRHAAEAATLAREVEQEIARLRRLAAELGERHAGAVAADRPPAAAGAAGEPAAARSQLADLERLLAGLTRSERELAARFQQLQLRVDAFRSRKEVLRARYTAARTAQVIDPSDAGDAALAQITAEIEAELGGQLPAEDLLELRAEGPGDREVCFLFAAEPPGTALVIAVLEDRAAVAEHYHEAVLLASDQLRRVRAGQAPESAGRAYPDAETFLGEFFAGTAAEIEAAAALLAGARAVLLAELRADRGLPATEVARQMGVRPERVAAIERAEPGATEIGALDGYVAALGGRLEVIADFGDERVRLR